MVIPTPEGRELKDRAVFLASSTKWVLSQRNVSGTWGDEAPDQELDKFVTTRHVAMTLVELGLDPDSAYLEPAMRYLSTAKAPGIDPYWRIELLALTDAYTEIVMADASAAIQRLRTNDELPPHLWPLPCFLLRFYLTYGQLRSQLGFSSKELIKFTLSDFSQVTGCRGDASLTAMTAAELWRCRFPGKQETLKQILEHLESRQTHFTLPRPRAGFESNYLRDFYLLRCVTRYPHFFRKALSPKMRDHVAFMVQSVYSIADDSHWTAVPAYGGRIGGEVSPTALAIRALVSYHSVKDPDFRRYVLANTLELILQGTN